MGRRVSKRLANLQDGPEVEGTSTRKNQIGKEGLSFMETYLKETETLERLDLWATALARRKKRYFVSNLVEISLSENQLR